MSLSMGIVFLISLLPFIFIPTVFNPYEFPKFIFLVIGVEILALFFVVEKLKKNKLLDISRIDIGVVLVLGFGLVNLISDIFGIDPKISLLGSNLRHQGFLTLIAGIILFFLTRFSFNSKSHFLFRKTVLVCAFFLSLISLWQFLAVNFLHNYSIPTYNNRIIGTMGNPNFLGGYLAMLLPFVFYSRNKFIRVLLPAMIMAVILFTQSVAAILAVGSIFLIWVILVIQRAVLWKKVKVFSIAIVFLIFIVLFFQRQIMPIRYSIWDNRGLIWSEGLKAVLKRPILGYGQENFELVFPQERHMKVDSAHNVFLEIAVSSGVVGLLLYIAINFYFLKRTSKWEIRLSIIVFLIVSQFNPLSISQIVLFWFLLGIASGGGEAKIDKI